MKNLDKETLERIQKDGANAYAINRDKARNPYYRFENMPTQTGQTVELWLAKAEAWQFGYEMEAWLRS